MRCMYTGMGKLKPSDVPVHEGDHANGLPLVGTMGMKLKPSEYKLMVHDGQMMRYPLWERLEATDGHPAKLIWVRDGVYGDKKPASCASGRVPCSFESPKDILSLSGGCPAEGIEVAVVNEVNERDVIVKAPDGVLEPMKILVTERMALR